MFRKCSLSSSGATVDSKKLLDRVVKLVKKMQKNRREPWKNIPLAKEALAIMMEQLPPRDENVTPADHRFICDFIINEDLLPEYDVPRLVLSLYEWRMKMNGLAEDGEGGYDPENIMDVKDAEAGIQRLRDYIDENIDMETFISKYQRHLKFDPVEWTEEWENIIYDVEKECGRRLRGFPRGMGFCFGYWHTKAEILAEYGIDWKSPGLMNPRVLFD